MIPAQADAVVEESCEHGFFTDLQMCNDNHSPFLVRKQHSLERCGYICKRTRRLKIKLLSEAFAIMYFLEILHLLNELTAFLAGTSFILIEIFIRD